MRHGVGLMVLGCLVLAPHEAPAQSGGSFQIPWSAFGAGGSSTAGGAFALSGIVASWDSGQSSGGSFTLQGGWGGPVATIDAPAAPIPTTFAWLPATPNPFTGRTSIGFALPATRHVQVAVFDVRGRRVRGLVDASLAPGRHHVTWEGDGELGKRLPTGIYFVKLDAGDIHSASRVVLVH